MRKSKYFLIGFISAAAVVVVNVIAAGAPVQNIFVSGETAVAADVNANFQELADRIDSTVVSYDYHDYITAASITQKVYNVDGQTNYDEETKNYSTLAGSRTVTRIRTLATVAANYHVFEESFNADALVRNSLQVYDADGSVLSVSFAFDDDVALFTSNMKVGQSWGGATTETDTPDAGTVIAGSAISRLLAIEEVSVASGSYVGCLKISSDRYGVGFGATSRVSWICPGVGMVKRIRFDADGSNPSVWELSSIS